MASQPARFEERSVQIFHAADGAGVDPSRIFLAVYAARPVPARLIHLAISVAVAPMVSSDRIMRSSDTEGSPASILATRD